MIVIKNMSSPSRTMDRLGLALASTWMFGTAFNEKDIQVRRPKRERFCY